MPTRFKSVLLLSLTAGAIANASPVLMDMSHSRVEIAVKATIDSFVAELQNYDLSVTEEMQTGQISAGIFRFNFASIKTGDADRDRDMNEWQQTDRFPEVVFTLTTLEPAAGGRSVARGRLRFHGVEQSVSFPISIESNKQTITMDGDVTIDTRDYGLPIIKKYLVLRVNPIVQLHFHLSGKLAGS